MEATQTTTSISTGQTIRRQVKIRGPKLFDLQQSIATSSARFKVVVCGRRWGKTRLGAYIALKGSCQGKRIWWVAPVIATARILWRLLKPLIQKIPGAKIRESEKVFFFPGNGELWIKSADQPDNLRGEGLDGLIIDEADYVAADVWSKILRPMLADRKGWALFISTPREENGWFHELYKRGEKDGELWASWNYPSHANPFLDPKEIDQAQEEMSVMEFEQEFGAKFVGQPDAVYHNFSSAVHVRPARLDATLPVYVGLDFNNSPRVAAFVQQDPTTKRLKAIGELYHPTQATTDQHAEMCAAWLESRGIKRFNNEFDKSRVIAIPDASGKAKQHTGKSDHEAFKAAGFHLEASSVNPPVKDRDNAVLAFLKNTKGEVRIQIDPSCRNLIEAFGKLKNHGRERSPYSHMLDAFGYVVYRLSKRTTALELSDETYQNLPQSRM